MSVGVVAGTTGGPATYGVELVRALDGLGDRELELTVLTDQPERIGRLERSRVRRLPLPSPWALPLWDNLEVPLALRSPRADVYHGTKHALPLLGVPRRTAGVVTIHDLAVLSEPETFERAQRLQLLVHLRHAARRARRVICVSEHAAADVSRRLGIERERIDVIPHGISGRFAPIQDEERRLALRRRYAPDGARLVCFVGTIQPRKRIGVAVDAVEQLRDDGLPVVLVIAGRRRMGFFPDWLRWTPPFVRVLGEVPAEQVVELYAVSDAMVSPSSFEGFGLTFAEAMACGCPVVGVAATSVPEVVGEGGILVERPEADLVARALGRLLRDPSLRRELSEKALARSRELSWERAARRTLEVYRRATGR